MRKIKLLVPFIAILLILAFFKIDFFEILRHLTKISFLYAGGVILLLYTCNFFLASSRLMLVTQQLNGVRLGYKDSCRTILMGQLGSAIPVFGAFLGQSIALNKLENLSYTHGAFITLYDKISMVIVGLLLSAFAGIFLFDLSLWSCFPSQFAIVLLLCIFCLSTFLAVTFGITAEDRRTLKGFITWENLLGTLIISCMSAVSWLLSATAFGIGAFLIYPQGVLLSWILGGVIISVIASLPLSVNGWGLREFGVITIFGLLGLPQNLALLISIAVGVFSYIALFLSMFIMSFVSSHTLFQRNLAPLHKMKSVAVPCPKPLSEQRIVYFLGCTTAVAIFFQMYCSWKSLTININIADIFACVGTLMMAMAYQQRDSWFDVPKTGMYILGLIGAFFFALVCGFLKYGYTHFAFINKFMGLFILLGYGALGAAFFYHHGMKGYHVLVRIMSLTLIAIVCTHIMLIFLAFYGAISTDSLPGSFLGFAANRNAFALQLLVLVALNIMHLDQSKRGFNNIWFWMTSVLSAGVYLTASRSGLITGIILGVALPALRLISKKTIMHLMIQSCMIISFLWAADFLFWALWAADFFGRALGYYSGASSDHERWYTIVEGLRLWLYNPLFGGGLGRFMFNELTKNRRPLVIHNTFVWIFSEFGLLGAAPFVVYGWRLFKDLYHRWSTSVELTEQKKSLFSLLIIFGAMGMVHEVFYQRCIWFVAGLLLAKTMHGKSKIQESVLE